MNTRRNIFAPLLLTFLCASNGMSALLDHSHVTIKYAIGPYCVEQKDGNVYRVGFFAALFGVLAHLDWCERTGHTPVVYWDKRSAYYDEKRGGNAWEYFFKPVSDAVYDPSCDTLSTNLCAPDHTVIKHFCKHEHSYRLFVHRIIEKYIHLQPHIQKRIDDFYQRHMRDIPTIGIHLRGTDKQREIRIPDPLTLIAKANELAQQYPQCQFLVATDEERLLELAKSHLHGSVISYDAQRSHTNMPVHQDRTLQDRAELGADVLIECILLSRCTKLVHSHSNVSYTATFFNPDIDDCFIHEERPRTPRTSSPSS